MEKFLLSLLNNFLEKNNGRQLSAIMMAVLLYWLVSGGVGELMTGTTSVKELETAAKNAKGELHKCDVRESALKAEVADLKKLVAELETRVRTQEREHERDLRVQERVLDDKNDEIADLKHQIQLMELFMSLRKGNGEGVDYHDFMESPTSREAGDTAKTTPKL